MSKFLAGGTPPPPSPHPPSRENPANHLVTSLMQPLPGALPPYICYSNYFVQNLASYPHPYYLTATISLLIHSLCISYIPESVSYIPPS